MSDYCAAHNILRNALIDCQAQFEVYADIHARKGNAEKERINREYAKHCEDKIAEAEKCIESL